MKIGNAIIQPNYALITVILTSALFWLGLIIRLFVD